LVKAIFLVVFGISFELFIASKFLKRFKKHSTTNFLTIKNFQNESLYNNSRSKRSIYFYNNSFINWSYFLLSSFLNTL